MGLLKQGSVVDAINMLYCELESENQSWILRNISFQIDIIPSSRAGRTRRNVLAFEGL